MAPAFCSWRTVWAAFGPVLLLGAVPPVSGNPPPGKPPVSFIADVAPILQKNCFGCHDARKRKGKFDLSTYETFRKGGGSGTDPIVPGKPEESPLLDRLQARDQSRMPPPEAGDSLPREQIALIERWIAEGAKLDAGLPPRADLLRELRVRWKPPPPPAIYRFPVAITALAFTPDARKLVVSGQHELTVWDVAQTRLEERVYTRAERTYALAFLPDGKLAVAGGRPGQEGDVRLYNLHGGTPRVEHGVTIRDGVHDQGVLVRQLLESDDAVLCLAVSPDGKRLASGGCDRLVHVWDLGHGARAARLEQTIENHADWVFGVAFAPDGKRLLTCGRDKTAKVWDLGTRESVLTFPQHQSPVYSVAMTPDGKIGISVGEDNQVRLWNAGDGKPLRTLGGHGKAIFRVLHHPTQPVLLTCSADGTVRSWNAATGQALHTLTGHTDWVYALALSPDGKWLASGSWDGEVRVWNVSDGTLVKAFQACPGFRPTTVATPK